VTLAPRFFGALSGMSPSDVAIIVDRARSDEDPAIEATVRSILARVRREGDAALFALTRELDRASLDALEVPRADLDAARARIPGDVARALERAARHLEWVNDAMRPTALEHEVVPGVVVGRRPDPLAAVGVYAPGGRAVYPSSVLMGVVPARVMGVREIVVCSPPGPSGKVSDVVLAAAVIGGATRVFSLGGAQAIGALAFGTGSVPRVDRIVGPGNAYVAEAKRQVAGRVAIDSPAGPSEILVLADGHADAAHVVRELLAQAEHDPEASVVAVVETEALARDVLSTLAASAPEKREVVQASLSSRGAVLWVDSLDQAYAFADAYAAEHLLILAREPEAVLARVRHAGTVFLGEGASVAFGDYTTGANHVLPTAGAARSFSGLGPLDFVRWTSYQRIDRAGAAALARDTSLLATSEGLPSHADAARAFIDDGALGAPRRVRSRAGYEALTIYSSPRGAVEVDLSDNTNPMGPPPAARAALAALDPSVLGRYPSLYAADLKDALAAYVGVSADQIVTGCGSDEVIDLALRAFGGPGARVAFPAPTFAMVPHFARSNGATPIAVPLLGAERGWDVDVDGLLAARAAITYVCSPNNPTGTLASPEAIERILEHASGLVILDEAYVEYGGASLVSRARAHGRLLVVRTLSKAFGMAGLRAGYAVASPEVVRELEKARGPYKVNAVAERVAAAAVRADTAWMRAGVADVLGERERFVAWLAGRGVSALPSSANFVFVPVPDAEVVSARLLSRGVAVRAFRRVPGFGDALRISVAPRIIMERAMPAFDEAFPCG
jgi:histidinol dehydrogenase